MSIIVDSSHTFLSSYSDSPFSASEEIFTLIDHKNCISYIFVHEKRRVNSRAIIRVVDYKNKIAKEERSRTLRFKIKSTFSSLGFIKKTAVHEKDIGNAEKNAQKERTDFSILSSINLFY